MFKECPLLGTGSSKETLMTLKYILNLTKKIFLYLNF